ncbi:MAG TPA: NADH-quinone oxidoreductase subunit M, partial [Actinomycetota bacterium]
MSGVPWLTVTVFAPLAGVVALALTTGVARLAGRRGSTAPTWRWGALVFSVAAFAASLFVLAGFQTGTAGFQLTEEATWAGPLGLRYVLAVDGVSLWMVLLTTFLMP